MLTRPSGATIATGACVLREMPDRLFAHGRVMVRFLRRRHQRPTDLPRNGPGPRIAGCRFQAPVSLDPYGRDDGHRDAALSALGRPDPERDPTHHGQDSDHQPELPVVEVPA